MMLDNVPNIKAYWIMMGLPMAQIALHFGANDVQGTVVREQIFQAAAVGRIRVENIAPRVFVKHTHSWGFFHRETGRTEVVDLAAGQIFFRE